MNLFISVFLFFLSILDTFTAVISDWKYVHDFPESKYPLHPIMTHVHTTRPHGACPDTIRHWNDHIDSLLKNNETLDRGLTHYTDVSPWMLRFDAALLKKNFFKPNGEVEACCRIWGGTPNFYLHLKKNKTIMTEGGGGRGENEPSTIYSFQPCGHHRQDFIKFFVKDVLSRIDTPINLYTGGNDCSLRSDPIAFEALNHPMLNRWYTENYVGEVVHRKITPLPIAACQTQILNLTLGRNPQTVAAVEKYLINWPNNILQTTATTTTTNTNLAAVNTKANQDFLPWSERSNLVFTCGFSPSSKGHRETWYKWIQKECPSDVCHPTCGNDNTLPQIQMWGNYTHYKFALAPPGRGVDTHRTWEILMMGTVPIITRTGSEAYAALPVIIVDHPSNITRTLLDNWTKQYGYYLDNYQNLMYRLNGNFWFDIIKSGNSTEAWRIPPKI